MKIVVFGATGKVGSRTVKEALSRNHEVTAVVRNAIQIHNIPDGAKVELGDAKNADDVERISRGHDLAINATRPPTGQEEEVTAVTQGLLDGLARTGVRLLVVGGAATLKVPGTDGRTVLDDTRFLPASARHIGLASARQFKVCSVEQRIDWAYLSPPADLAPGDRTGQYRLGCDELLIDESGSSSLSMEDLAVVLLDEAEKPRHHQTRFTAAY